jgi:nucleoside-diphosphate-sugar epimerase
VLEAVAEAGAVCKVVLVTSVGTTRTKDFPFSFLNLFGVLDAKRAGEEALVRAGAEKGFQWVIVRPGRLIGGPYSNPDLAKLFKVASESGGEGGVKLEAGDGLLGDCSRDRLAACVTACVVNPVAGDVDFSIIDDDEREGLGRGGWGEELARLKEFTV